MSETLYAPQYSPIWIKSDSEWRDHGVVSILQQEAAAYIRNVRLPSSIAAQMRGAVEIGRAHV